MQVNNSNESGTSHSDATSSNHIEIIMGPNDAIDDAIGQSEQNKTQLEIVLAETKPIIDNLEYFPETVLLNIFSKTDDTGLHGLSEISCRFATITPIVFEERYANDKYFVINGERCGGDREIYSAQFDRFGKFISAIQINEVYGIDENHWLVNIFENHIHHIEKLAFNDCVFESSNILSRTMSITHLTLQNVHCSRNIDLSECHDLEKLEIRDTLGISHDSLKQTIRNNPSLQSLTLPDAYIDFEFLVLIADSLNHLKELSIGKIQLSLYSLLNRMLLLNQFEIIVNSFEHLESLALTVGYSSIELMRRIGTVCKSLKRLELHVLGDNDDLNNQVFLAIRLFQKIESLHLDEYTVNVNSLVEHLPHLRHLCFETMSGKNYKQSDVLPLFVKCSSLEKITIIFRNGLLKNQGCFVHAPRLFKNFIETVISGKPNARVEVQVDGQIIGCMSENGIVWRNKLMYWTGHDSNQSLSNVQLLDVAKHAVKSNAVQKNLLDQIFDYLDVHSLCAFGNTNKRSKQLVENYIVKHLQQRGTFTITDEFKLYNSLANSSKFNPYIFAMHVDVLKIDNINNSNRILDNYVDIVSKYVNLKKLTIYSERDIDFRFGSLQQVQHFSFDFPYFMGYSDLCKLSQQCPNVEIVEFKKAGLFKYDYNFTSGKRLVLNFRNLKKFIFGYRSETQLNNLKKIFENTNTELVPIYQN